MAFLPFTTLNNGFVGSLFTVAVDDAVDRALDSPNLMVAMELLLCEILKLCPSDGASIVAWVLLLPVIVTFSMVLGC